MTAPPVLLVPQGWQPISTWNNDDPDPILSDGVSTAMGEWCHCEGGHWIVYGGSPEAQFTPTHWMPRPPLPSLVPDPEEDTKTKS